MRQAVETQALIGENVAAAPPSCCSHSAGDRQPIYGRVCISAQRPARRNGSVETVGAYTRSGGANMMVSLARCPPPRIVELLRGGGFSDRMKRIDGEGGHKSRRFSR